MSFREGPSWLHRLVCLALEQSLPRIWGVGTAGLGRVPGDGPLIVAANHRSWVDPPLVGMVLSRVRYPLFLAKAELFRNPASAWFFRRVGCIPLDRRRGDVSALRSAEQALGDGGCVVLFPEGTRSRGGAFLRPKPGVGFLAHRTGAPVVPARVRNTEGFPAPAPLGVSFGRPLRYGGDGGRGSYQEFAQRVMEEIAGL